MRFYQFLRAGSDPRSVPEYRPGYPGERTDPDVMYKPDKYDNDFIWDGETMDDEKP